MVEVGKYNNLRIVKEVDFGLYLDGGDLGEILLPKRYILPNSNVDDIIEVFIYMDSEDRLIATTEKPYATVDEFAVLRVASVSKYGAFLDWGLMKDLLVPFREQDKKMEEGKYYIVRIYLDKESNRIAASSYLNKFLDNLPPDYEEMQEVDLFICNDMELGYNAIINGTHWGMLYKNEVFKPLRRGDKMKGYIKKVREDEKIDLCLEKPGYDNRIDNISKSIIDILKEEGGYVAVTDKSSPEIIKELFEMSKKNFKKAIGTLYRKKLIIIEEKGIRLI